MTLASALNQAQEDILTGAEPEEIATIERVFDAISKHEVQGIHTAAGLDSDPES